MKNFCVIGFPVGQSLSPRLFNAWFKDLGIDAKYEAIEVAPAQLGKFMRKFREKFSGASVTIPHKEKIIKYLDVVDSVARKIGAVNTIVNRGGKLIGYNTDVIGVMVALEEGMKDIGVASAEKEKKSRSCCDNLRAPARGLRGKRVVILGAGGAARAAVYGLTRAGAQVTILNRTLSHAKSLAREFKCGFGCLEDFRMLACDILINATSVGMHGSTQNLSPLNLSTSISCYPLLSTPPIVLDLIYRPRLTKLLRTAKKLGFHIITGDHMFLAQAAASLKLWIGKKNQR